MIGRESTRAAFLPAFGLSAKPLRHLGYLIEDPMQAVVMGADVVLVNVPSPARFAMHKLWISGKRPAAFQAKATKDRIQAGQLIEVLSEDRPDDLRDAWGALPRPAARSVRSTLQRFDSELAERVTEILDTR